MNSLLVILAWTFVFAYAVYTARLFVRLLESAFPYRYIRSRGLTYTRLTTTTTDEITALRSP